MAAVQFSKMLPEMFYIGDMSLGLCGYLACLQNKIIAACKDDCFGHGTRKMSKANFPIISFTETNQQCSNI